MTVLRPARLLRVIALAFTLLCSACGDSPRSDAQHTVLADHPKRVPDSSAADDASSLSAFDAYLTTEFPPADGFDFPTGDRNGNGQHGTATLQPVYAVANGRVAAAENFGGEWGKAVVIEHLFYENHERRTLRSIYPQLDTITVQPGEIVERRQQIGALHNRPLALQLRTDTAMRSRSTDEEGSLDPDTFIRERRTLFVPQQEKRLILIDHELYRMRLYTNGRLHGEYDLSFGQAKGRKRIEGDRRTPKGMYFIVEREQGEQVTGPMAAYMGGHWLKLNYPNKYDAAWGYGEGHISKGEAQEISTRWEKRKSTPQQTALGGGIGLHGWISEWENDETRHRSWGCIVMHNRDIPTIYDLIPMGTMVVVW